MLKQRILTALALLLVLLPALFHPDIRYLALIGLILIAVAVWEWSRLNHFNQTHSVLWGIASAGLCALIYWTDAFDYFAAPFWLFISATWVLLGSYILQGGQVRWQSIHRWIRLLIGLGILISSWLALYQSKNLGTGFLLSILLLVWVADIAAYFAGRSWGQHKLAPQISPGKSWEGLIGGVVGVFVLSIAWLNLDEVFPILQAGLFQKLFAHGWLVFVASVLFLSLMSVVGDLIESLIKRSVGAKDSSRLLPGHGGVLDRLDALLPVLPIAMMLMLFGAPT
jgi:phosphatidate cytidylyltransferase